MISPLTEREKDLLGIALSNYADVQGHVRGRVDEVLDLAIKLGVRAYQIRKGLSKAMDARRRAAEGGAK